MLVALASETASLAESGFSPGRHAQYSVAARAHYYSLGVAENSCAAHVHMGKVKIQQSCWCMYVHTDSDSPLLDGLATTSCGVVLR